MELSDVIALSSSPFKLLRDGGKYGLNAIGKVLPVFLLFFFLNLGLVVFGGYRIIHASHFGIGIAYFGAMIAVWVVVTIIAGIRLYKLVRADLFSALYSKSEGFFHKLSDQIVVRSRELYLKSNGKGIETVVDAQRFLVESYGKVPGIIRNLILFFLKRIPFYDIIKASRESILNDEKNQASQLMFVQIDTSIKDSVKKSKRTRWIYMLLIVNVVLQLVLVWLIS